MKKTKHSHEGLPTKHNNRCYEYSVKLNFNRIRSIPKGKSGCEFNKFEDLTPWDPELRDQISRLLLGPNLLQRSTSHTTNMTKSTHTIVSLRCKGGGLKWKTSPSRP
eukprot:m.264050 g.264050  ORF g.264050 m.264050 type:complete len:107 (+) comp53642_c0_seq1:180-500(+)